MIWGRTRGGCYSPSAYMRDPEKIEFFLICYGGGDSTSIFRVLKGTTLSRPHPQVLLLWHQLGDGPDSHWVAQHLGAMLPRYHKPPFLEKYLAKSQSHAYVSSIIWVPTFKLLYYNHITSAIFIFKAHRLQFPLGKRLATKKLVVTRCHWLVGVPSPWGDMIIVIP